MSPLPLQDVSPVSPPIHLMVGFSTPRGSIGGESGGSGDEQFHDAPDSPSKRRKAKVLAQNAKALPAKVFTRLVSSPGKDDFTGADGGKIEGITDNAMFNTSTLYPPKETRSAGLIDSVASISHAVAHPRRHMKARAVAKIDASEHPYLPEDHDHELLQAHDEFTSMSPSDETSDRDVAL